MVKWRGYLTPSGFVVRVIRGGGNWWRASTCDHDFYFLHEIDQWDWKPSEEEAQQELDALASTLKLEPFVKEIP